MTIRPRPRVGAVPCTTFLVLFLLVLLSPLASTLTGVSSESSQSAKQDYGLIYGTVWGPDDHPVAGVPIKIRKASEKKAKWELMSDRNGEFAQRVPPGPGDYVVQANVKTAKGQPKPETKVHIDNDEREDISLHLTKEMLTHQ